MLKLKSMRLTICLLVLIEILIPGAAWKSPSMPSPEWTIQALSLRAAASDRYKIDRESGRKSDRSPIWGLMKRSTFFALIAATIAAPTAFAINGGKAGIPISTYQIPVKCGPFNQGLWQNPDAAAVLDFLKEWIQFKYRHKTTFSEPPFFPQVIESALKDRSELCEKLLARETLQTEFLEALRLNNIQGFAAAGTEERWNQLLFVAIPTYAARRGIYVHHTGTAQGDETTPLLPIQESIQDSLSIYRVKSVDPNRREMIWGQSQTVDEIIIDGYFPLGNLPPRFEDEMPTGLNQNGNIFHFIPSLNREHRQLMGHVAQAERDSWVEGTKKMEWEQAMSNPDNTIDAAGFSYLKLMGFVLGFQNRSSVLGSWRTVWVRFHERMHRLDTWLEDLIQIRRYAIAQELSQRTAWIMTSEFRGNLSGARHSAREFPELVVLDILLKVEEPKMIHRGPSLHLLSGMIDVILESKARNAQSFPTIRLVQNHPRHNIRAQILGQLYRLRGADAELVFRLVYERYAQNRRTPLPLLGPEVRVQDLIERSLANPTPSRAKAFALPIPPKRIGFAA